MEAQLGPYADKEAIMRIIEGAEPHEALFLIIRELYGFEGFVRSLKERKSSFFTHDLKGGIILMDGELVVSRADVDEDGRPAPEGSTRSFSFAGWFPEYIFKKLQESFLKFDMPLELFYVTTRYYLHDYKMFSGFMLFYRSICLEVLRHLTVEQAQDLGGKLIAAHWRS
ncbi:hypothetical protein [Candidatus Magnetaquicoccus inordinatus]|uniref:hypothetical protein n=1 Tax=Candidatus Magnetaquicoccus inordinatus TaxID=2496818 RepID=UPI00102CCFDD|nr:hypothetical protein [Candidatus Magnetaquicoccus inordinatus]